ncbi:MAG: diguanylate cyclase, partial [Thiohalophilus sp.]
MKSIKYKILTIAILPILVFSAVLTVSQIKNRTSDAEYQLKNKIRAMSRTLSDSVEYGIVSGNNQYTNALLSEFVGSSEIVNVIVYDKNNKILNEVQGKGSSYYDDINYINIKTDIYRSIEPINDFHEAPEAKPEKIGTLSVTASTIALNVQKKHIIIEGVIITGLLLIITFIATSVYIKSITNPFRKMLHGIDIIKDGYIGYQLESTPILELNVLARHINNMSAALKEAQDKLLETTDNEVYAERSKALVTLESIGEGVITTDNNANITYMNPAAELLTGIRFKNAEGKSIHSVLRTRRPGTEIISSYPVEKVIKKQEPLQHDPHLTLIKSDNSEIVIKDTASPIMNRDGDVIGMALVFHDFSSIKHMSDKLAYQASHDDLTDLYNRREFEKQLEDALDDAQKRNTEHALCYLDLDQFKIINDTCGHLAGDILLKQISMQIRNQVRRHDLIARLGGDEFGIIFFDTDIKQAESLAENIKQSVTDFKYIWQDNSFDVGVSIGLVPINASVSSHSELLIRADSACYIAKDNGRNCIHTYAASDIDFIRRSDELHWYNRITDALENNQFELYCQEIRSVVEYEKSEDQQHYEILLRMTADDKTIWPAEFIPAAERYLLMPRIDRWVLDSFIQIFETNAIERFGGDIYSINLSGQSLCNDEFLDYTIKRLQGQHVTPESIIFEITETAAISNLDKALNFINSLKELGCQFSLDDFGTGVSSFQYLHDLPVDYLKIDGKFIRNIDNNQINHSIIS